MYDLIYFDKYNIYCVLTFIFLLCNTILSLLMLQIRTEESEGPSEGEEEGDDSNGEGDQQTEEQAGGTSTVTETTSSTTTHKKIRKGRKSRREIGGKLWTCWRTSCRSPTLKRRRQPSRYLIMYLPCVHFHEVLKSNS